MGFLGAAIPEDHGGLGLGALDLGVIMEALGGANAAVPFMSSIILGAEAIRLAGSEAQKAAWLPKLASGDAIATFAYAEGPGRTGERRVWKEWVRTCRTRRSRVHLKKKTKH